MNFMVLYPVKSDRGNEDWIDPAKIVGFAQGAESAGINAVGFTEHPAPSRKWLDGGGHETFDPFAALSYVAAVTKSLRLVTYLTVVPYRNPFLLAKSMTSVDVLSGGRATFVVGVGYLRSEFSALGVEFAERNDLFEEAIEVIRDLWQGNSRYGEGIHFRAFGVTLRPGPVQRPHPPLWVGGNGKVVRERVARWGQGWAPQVVAPEIEKTARTASIASDQQLAGYVRTIGDRMEELGRDRSILDVATTGVRPLPLGSSAEQHIEAIGRLSAIGVTWMPIYFPHGSYQESMEWLAWFGQEVVTKCG